MEKSFLSKYLENLKEQVKQYNMRVSTYGVQSSRFAYAEIRYQAGNEVHPVGVLGINKRGEKPALTFVEDNDRSWQKNSPLERVKENGENCKEIDSKLAKIQARIEKKLNDKPQMLEVVEEYTLF